ncbi:putative alpha-1 adrenergic receptor [Schistosoma mansoni]|uniref:putative alpha-1 adrenergic receptor n=1 Tax=Schistosoma mansoni TaxID=6183 RepID=UPI0001A639C3|nr:putative alpha-1 adrenergic receptor [Schistosoma mansoni]|eukprot:XP_018653511.1 putative alpha-1 adrenergic receptor [Schistosoma mansoni]
MIFSIATLFGNSLVVLSVIRERSLRNATNWFIVSLAIADISLAILVMPLATWLELVGCLIWFITLKNILRVGRVHISLRKINELAGIND